MIDRPRNEVASYAADPDNVPRWYVNIRSVDWRIEQRAAIAVLSELHWPATRIAYACQIHRSTIARWTGRFAAGHDGRDHDRSGRPATLTDQVEIRAVAFYCQTAPLPGCKRWSLRWAEKYLKQNPDELGLSPSRSSLQRLLARQKLAPHRHKYFLQITDPDFFPKMESLIQLYLHPPEYLYCFDECPCIQALNRRDVVRGLWTGWKRWPECSIRRIFHRSRGSPGR